MEPNEILGTGVVVGLVGLGLSALLFFAASLLAPVGPKRR
jgi:hypothetical protein